MKLPEEFELLSFFGVEPELRVPGAPWAFNGLTFVVVRGESELRCHIEADVGELKVSIKHGEHVISSAAVRWVGQLSVENHKNSANVLFAANIRGNPDLTLEIHVGSEVAVKCNARPSW